jgi:uncharacterized protein (TIGR00369 family)
MTAQSPSSAERARRANEFAKPKHPGIGANLPEGASFTTIELETNFLGAVREGGAICGRAVPAHRGRTTQVWDVTVTDEANAKVIALFRCTQMVLHGQR